MKLSDCKIGEIVVLRSDKETDEQGQNIGHIVGLSVNETGDVIPLVLFANGVQISVHHRNINIYQD